MNTEILGRKVRLPLPRTGVTEAWVVDLTKPKLLRKTYTSNPPYNYTPAGQIVRMAMPARGQERAEPLMRHIRDLIERMRVGGMLPPQFDLGPEYDDDDCAQLVLATALIERDTPFATYRIEPSGRTIYCYRMALQVAQHPDRPKGGL